MYESFDENFKESGSWCHMLGTILTYIKGLVLPTFMYGTEIWKGDLKNSHWKVFEKGMKMHIYDVPCQSMFFDYLSYLTS